MSTTDGTTSAANSTSSAISTPADAGDAVPHGLVPADVLASATPVAVYGYARAKAGREEELLAEIRKVIAPTRAEAGYEQYEVHTTAEDPRAFAFYERWSSGPALLAHVSQPFMQAYFAAIGELVEGELEAHWLRPLTARSAGGVNGGA
ncbi:putative quinol monooxygenase [Kineococcus sp. SYSU DK006]|uniref:putative quinol monooxygenase n=1 Tax=Kineococcus sp. SYSU DK006 TaxID=3383127 RepID=UPI003D7E151A